MGTNQHHLTSMLQSRMEHLEQRFGGLQKGVPRRKVSRYDPRTRDALAVGGMQGGDRMNVHGYAAHYATYLQPFMDQRDLVVVELGILRGSGLAVLCELFPRAARIIGLDVDTSHYREHRGKLEALGAFRKRKPEVHEFDELAPDAATRLAGILATDRVHVFIHDALHYDDAILGTLAHAHRHFARRYRCFIEDNATVATALAQTYGHRHTVGRHGRLSVMWNDA
jgi:hypothetical protein